MLLAVVLEKRLCCKNWY